MGCERAIPATAMKGSDLVSRVGTLAVLGTGFVILAGLAAAGCHSTPALTPQQAEGKHLYDSRCAHCHEFNDLALKKVPPNLHGVFDSPHLPSGVPATDVNVERTVLSGKNLMPSFAGRFTQQQMAALLAYLHAGIRSQ
ncbi:MAG TPA: cytochrome c [Terracidiphilus sp.]|jgi:cytochrome c2|nr:cytochrome c [Terracidiphilus sp.]